MDQWLLYLLLALATHRLSRLISLPEDGPFELVSNLHLFVQKHTASGSIPAWVRDGLACYYCVSFWVAAFFSGLAFLIPSPVPLTLGAWVVGWLGLAGAVSVMRAVGGFTERIAAALARMSK